LLALPRGVYQQTAAEDLPEDDGDLDCQPMEEDAA
jgi:hypothetical protein